MIEPWSKFFWSDYDADEGLRVCSLAAQGLWMRMLCLMARATPKGELRIGGEPCSVSDLSKLVGESEETVAALLNELTRRGVYSATRTGVIFSRRMRKDAEISRKRAESGKKGGIASIGNKTINRVCLSKIQAKGEAKLKPQKPEARTDTIVSGVPPPLSEQLFGGCLHYVVSTGQSEKSARSLIGRWRKNFGDPEVVRRIAYCQANGISNPVEYVPKMSGGAAFAKGDRQEFLEKRYGKG